MTNIPEWENTFWIQKEFKIDYAHASRLVDLIRSQIASAKLEVLEKIRKDRKTAKIYDN